MSYLARADQVCAELEDLTSEEEEFRELADSLRKALMEMWERIEGKLRAE